MTVPEGAKEATFSVNTDGVDATVNRIVTATLDGVSAQAQLTVHPVSDFIVTLNPPSVNGGSNSTGTVTYNGKVGPSGRTVALSSNKLFASVPASVNVAAGLQSANFTVTTQDPGANDTATITGMWNGLSRSAALEVISPFVVTVMLNPDSTKGGNALELRVTMTPAPPTDRTFNLTGDGVLEPPGSITIPAGKTVATLGVKTKPVLNNAVGKVTLTNAFGLSKDAMALIMAPTLDRIVPTVHTVTGQTSIPLVVMLDGPAAAGVSFAASSSNTNWATVPSTVTIPEGAILATININAKKVSVRRDVTITVGTKTVTLVLLPAP